MADPKPGDGNAARLKRYWITEGRAQWDGPGIAHPWTTLRRLLKSKGVPERMLDGLTTNIYVLAKGHGPGRD